MIEVAVIEDRKDYRDLLLLLVNHTQGFQCTFIAESAEEAMKKLPGKTPQIAIVDIGLPGKNGIELVKWIREHFPKTLCMVCTAYDEDEKVFDALEAGAHGYMLKSTDPSEIISALKDLYNGGSPMSSGIARKVVMTFQKQSAAPSEYQLTTREQQILSLLSKGLLYKEIGAQLHISINTVRCHCFNIYEKLHVSNRTEAINKYNGKS